MQTYSPLIKTFLELVSIDSESFYERDVADYVKSRIGKYFDDYFEDDASEKLGGNCGNQIIYIKGNRADYPVIMLNSHMDTVKPGIGIKTVIEGDIIKSSGETILGGDDKAGLCVIIELLSYLKENRIDCGDLQIVLTVAEEQGIKGASQLDTGLIKADFGYTLDNVGTAGDIFIASPYHDKITAKIVGKAAHAGMEPEKGVSAIQVVSKAISRMKLGRIDEETTANVGIIKGGRATNIIPDTVCIEAEARSHNQEKIQKQINHMREIMDVTCRENNAKLEIEINREYSGYMLDEGMQAVKVAMNAARLMGIEPCLRTSGGGSDANVFNKSGIQVAPLGTAMRNCHTTEEDISMTELEGVFEYVKKIIENPID